MIWSDALCFVATAVIFCIQIHNEGHNAIDKRVREGVRGCKEGEKNSESWAIHVN